MYKGYVDLGRISSNMKLKYNLILKSNDYDKYKKNIQDNISKFSYKDNEYLRLAPKGYISIDISTSDEKGDNWNGNSVVNLNKQSLFWFTLKLKDMIDSFKIPKLYYYKEGKLVLNKEVAEQNRQSLRVQSGKTIGMTHCIVYDKDNKDLEYEGIMFMINTPDNFCMLTYLETQYLYYELSHINMNELGLQLMTIDLLTKDTPTEITETLMQEETSDISIENSKSLPRYEEPSTIPDL